MPPENWRVRRVVDFVALSAVVPVHDALPCAVDRCSTALRSGTRAAHTALEDELDVVARCRDRGHLRAAAAGVPLAVRPARAGARRRARRRRACCPTSPSGARPPGSTTTSVRSGRRPVADREVPALATAEPTSPAPATSSREPRSAARGAPRARHRPAAPASSPRTARRRGAMWAGLPRSLDALDAARRRPRPRGRGRPTHVRAVRAGLPVTEPDLLGCADEPIRIPGAVQPHGALLASAGPRLAVVVASANAAALLGREVAGRPLAELVDPDALEGGLALRTAVDGRDFDVSAHRADGLLVTEWEPVDAAHEAGATWHRRLPLVLQRLQAADDLDALCVTLAARGARAHRLRPGDGLPLRPGVERRGGRRAPPGRPRTVPRPALPGERHPGAGARAVPAQLAAAHPRRPLPPGAARAARATRSTAARSTSAAPRCAACRRCTSSTSPTWASIASMSVSLVDGDRLWGLVACHHYAGPHRPSPTDRVAAEFLGRTASLLLEHQGRRGRRRPGARGGGALGAAGAGARPYPAAARAGPARRRRAGPRARGRRRRAARGPPAPGRSHAAPRRGRARCSTRCRATSRPSPTRSSPSCPTAPPSSRPRAACSRCRCRAAEHWRGSAPRRCARCAGAATRRPRRFVDDDLRAAPVAAPVVRSLDRAGPRDRGAVARRTRSRRPAAARPPPGRRGVPPGRGGVAPGGDAAAHAAAGVAAAGPRRRARRALPAERRRRRRRRLVRPRAAARRPGVDRARRRRRARARRRGGDRAAAARAAGVPAVGTGPGRCARPAQRADRPPAARRAGDGRRRRARPRPRGGCSSRAPGTCPCCCSARTGPLLVGEPRGPALGVVASAAYGEADLPLTGTDRLVLFSDGLVERRAPTCTSGSTSSRAPAARRRVTPTPCSTPCSTGSPRPTTTTSRCWRWGRPRA